MVFAVPCRVCVSLRSDTNENAALKASGMLWCVPGSGNIISDTAADGVNLHGAVCNVTVSHDAIMVQPRFNQWGSLDSGDFTTHTPKCGAPVRPAKPTQSAWTLI